MDDRKPPPLETENEVLLLCRRRCCICFGLNRNLEIVQGEIAHLNHERSNNSRENLAYLCLPHHDQYDSRTSQSKGLRPGEVKQFRSELHKVVLSFLTSPVQLGAVHIDEPIEGRYVLDGSGEKSSAEVQVKLIAHDRIRMTGFAQFRSAGSPVASLGFLDFETGLREGRKAFHENRTYGYYRLVMTFERGLLFLEEYNSAGMFGRNVGFRGMYRRVGEVQPEPPIGTERRKTRRLPM
jgi:hypothetical protein